MLEVAPTNEEALFARSAVLYETKGEDVKALQAAHEGFEAFVAVHPDSPRTGLAQQLSQFAEETAKAGGREKWKAARAKERSVRLSQPLAARPPMPGTPGGTGQPDGTPTLTPEMVDAVQNTERTPELEAGLAKLVEEGEEHLARGRFEEALGVYRRVVPFQPENGRAKAGMAWALVGLGRGAMADRVWGVAVGSDAAAVEKLGDTLQAKGDAKGAKAVWAKLLASAPDYPNKAGPAGQGRPVAALSSDRTTPACTARVAAPLASARNGGQCRRCWAARVSRAAHSCRGGRLPPPGKAACPACRNAAHSASRLHQGVEARGSPRTSGPRGRGSAGSCCRTPPRR